MILLLLLLKNAQDIVDVYKRVALLEIQLENRRFEASSAWRELDKAKGKIATLEIENETLLREVEHWKAEGKVARAKQQTVN